MVPAEALPPTTPFTNQSTEVFVVPLTVAANCFVPPGANEAEVGETATDTVAGGAVIETEAFAALVVSALLRAVTVTVGVAGTAAGAVYTPLDVMVPLVELPPATPLTSHVTAVLVVPETVDVNCFEVDV